MVASAAMKVRTPSGDRTVERIAPNRVSIVPGCITQERISISARVTPRPLDFIKARRQSTCPRKATNTVANDISMVLAKSAVSSAALAEVRTPCVLIYLPYLGPRAAIIK